MHPKPEPHASPQWPPDDELRWHDGGRRRRLARAPAWLAADRAAWLARERSLALWMHGASTRAWVTRVLAVVSRAGDGWPWYAAIALLPWLGGAVGTSASVRMIGVAIVNLLIYWIVKRCIARPRPYRTCPGIRACTRSLDEFSFPSGHTLHAVSFSLILTVYFPWLGFVVWPFTALLATSRIVLGVHYPSDVIVGAIVGAITAGVSFNLL